MVFKVGQKVVCVYDKDSGLTGTGPWIRGPSKGKIYTITKTGLVHRSDPSKLPCVLVAELDRDESCPLWAHRFRPLVENKADISVFTEILTPRKPRALRGVWASRGACMPPDLDRG